jgi:hypothetical protein
MIRQQHICEMFSSTDYVHTVAKSTYLAGVFIGFKRTRCIKMAGNLGISLIVATRLLRILTLVGDLF